MEELNRGHSMHGVAMYTGGLATAPRVHMLLYYIILMNLVILKPPQMLLCATEYTQHVLNRV